MSSHAVRFRVCQLVNKLLGSLSENAQVDDELCERIHAAMLIRVTDKYPNVRIQAALAMARLQDPENPECPTVKGTHTHTPLQHLLSHCGYSKLLFHKPGNAHASFSQL